MGQEVQSDCSNYISGGFVVHGVKHSGVCVLRSGGLSIFRYLDDPVDFTIQPFPLGLGIQLIAPYWANISLLSGSIVFGMTDEKELIEKANKCINDAFPCQANFSSIELLVVTWEKVAAVGGIPTQTNTFQVVLATDGDRTYVIFLYADNGIGWSASGGQHAQVGISIDDIKETHPDSGTPDIIKVATGSNVNVPGKYIHHIDVAPSFSTKRSDYYFGYFQNLGSPQLSIIITTQESELIPYIVEAPGVGYSATGFVTREDEVVLNLPNNLIATSNGNQGVYLKIGSEKVNVIGQNLVQYAIDTFLCLPTQASDTYVYFAVSLSRNGYFSSLLIVGTEDNTTVSVTSTSGVPSIYMIDRLQTVLIKDLDDLTGTKIVADKPISVFSGHQCAHIPTGVAYCDHIVEQIPPTSSWGRVFYTSPLATRRSYTIKVLAAYNSTNVDIYCNNAQESHIINEGGSISKALSLSEYCAIASDKPVMVNQFAHGTSEDNVDGDPMMTLIPATNQYDNNFQFSTLQGLPEYAHYANIVVLADDFQSDMISMTGCGMSSLLGAKEWEPIKVNNITEAYSTQIQITEGVNEVVHSDPDAKMTVTVYGFRRFEAYGHPGGIAGAQ